MLHQTAGDQLIGKTDPVGVKYLGVDTKAGRTPGHVKPGKKPSAKHAPPKPIPVISHASSSDSVSHSRILTNQKCHIEEVELYAEVI